MKEVLALVCVLILAFTLAGGCSSQEAPEKETGAAGHPEEVADTTRLDSAEVDTAPVEAVEPAPDTGEGGR